MCKKNKTWAYTHANFLTNNCFAKKQLKFTGDQTKQQFVGGGQEYYLIVKVCTKNTYYL